MSKANIFIILVLIGMIPIASAQPIISPESQLYKVKIIIDDISEFFEFNGTQQVIMKQQHLSTYLKDLNLSNNNVYIIEKIKEKQKEIDDKIPQLNPDQIETIRHNQEVLYNLLNSSTMPFQSKKGLQNAYNNSMTKIIIKIQNYKNMSVHKYTRTET